MRKLILTAVAAVAAMACMVTPAAAVVDFPHETESSKWTAIDAWDWNGSPVNSSECSLTEKYGECLFGNIASRRWLFFGMPTTNEASLYGKVGKSGEVDITDGQGMMSSTAPLGQICQHILTKEFWVRLPMSESGSLVAFGRLATSPGPGEATSFTGATFGAPAYGILARYGATFNGIPMMQHVHFAELANPSSIAMIASEDPDACDWPELS